MRRQLNVAKSMGGDVFMPMASINRCRWRVLPMTWKEDLEVASWSMAVSQFVTAGWFYVFLNYLNHFVLGFCLNLEFEFWSCLVVAL